jgi:vacuolar-type H+-ATPase subunit I/STV1
LTVLVFTELLERAKLCRMKFAKIVFRVAGIWGFLIITPLYFIADLIGKKDPPPITHPAFYYGFVGVALVWQVAFLMIATDPVRFRPLMIAAIFEKLVYVIPTAILVAQKRTNPNDLLFVATDSLLCVLFVFAYQRTPQRS